jgi:nitrogen regulatory protein PII
MKLIIAIIQAHKLDDVMNQLDEKEIYLKTVSNVLGCGRQKGVTEIYRGVKEAGTLLKKVRLEIGGAATSATGRSSSSPWRSASASEAGRPVT